MKKAILLFCLSLIFSISIIAQETDLRQIFLEAESYFLFEEYNEALPLYLQIHRHYPDNDNINYKIGVCFINSPYEKDKSIVYLEKAVKDISQKYRENNYKETSAPPEALFYLGNACRINNQLDKAKEYYHKFLNVLDPQVYDTSLVMTQIAACDAAASLMKKPIDFDRQDLSGRINTRFAETNPVVSGDETKMIFISKLQFYDAIFFTEKVNGEWKSPRNIIPELGVDGDVYPTSLSYDGTELFIYRSDQFIGNLYYSKYINGKWTPLVKLNDNINTRYWESHASMTRDRKTLYFTSNRKGGYGGLDIYRSERQANGDWGPAVNLGPTVNSKYNDDTPFITENGSKLYFSSYGHYNMGGYDNFVSIKKSDGTWAEPVNLGYPVNTTDDDQFFFPLKDGQVAYYSRYSPEGYGKLDIYRYEIYSPDNPRMFSISGLLKYNAENVDSSEINISVVKQLSKDTIVRTHPYRNGEFHFSVPEGNYNMIFDGERFRQHMQQLSVSSATPHEGLILPEEIRLETLPQPLTQEEADNLLSIKDSVITTDTEGEVKVRFNAEKDSRAVVEVYHDSTLVKTDTIVVNRKRQSYEFTPAQGSNKVVITIEDEDGNKVQKSTEVILQTKEPEGKQENQGKSGKPPVVSQAEEPSQDENTDILRNKLKAHAEGSLANVLDTLHPEQAGLTSAGQLTGYLKDHAQEFGYAPEDVQDLVEKTATMKDLSEFIRDMQRVSQGQLKQTLSDFNPESAGVHSPRELVDHLLQTASGNGYKPEDVIQSLGILASQETDDPFFLLEILKSKTSGNLSDYLDFVKLEDEDIRSAGDLAVNLYEHASEANYPENELIDLLTVLAVNRDASQLRKALSKVATGDLKELLDTLDLMSDHLYTAGDLSRFLYENKYGLNYSRDDVDDAMKEKLNQDIGKIEDLRLKMEEVSEGKLHEYLSSGNLGEGKFTSEEEFIAFLRNSADSMGYSAADIDQALLKLTNDSDRDAFIRKIAEYASSDLKKRLLSMDPAKEGLNTPSDVVLKLFEEAGKDKYNSNDVIRMLSDYASMSDLQLFLKKLAELSKGNLRDFILAIDTGKLGINTKQELINYLLNQADNGTIDKSEIILVILDAEEISASTVMPALEALAGQDLGNLLQLTPGSVISAGELFTDLLERAGKNNPVTKGDILDLFENYLRHNDLHQFRNNLIENASPDLVSVLRETLAGKNEISNPEDLVVYLLDQANQHAYTKEDVYQLLARTAGQNDVKLFMEKMKPFASGSLRKALDELDPGKAGISSVDELIRYLNNNAGRYGYSPSETGDIMLRIIMDQTAVSETSNLNLEKEFIHKRFRRGVRLTAGILVLEGLVIFFLILLARRKRKKEEPEK